MVFDIKSYNVETIIKLARKGKIDDAYYKIYLLAEQIAIHETERYEAKLLVSSKIKTNEDLRDHHARLLDYKKERIEFHIQRMLELVKETSKTS